MYEKHLLLVNSPDSYKFCEHLHADREGISFELILEKILKLIYYSKQKRRCRDG